jgi:hypothetical protein
LLIVEGDHGCTWELVIKNLTFMPFKIKTCSSNVCPFLMNLLQDGTGLPLKGLTFVGTYYWY